MSQLLILFDFLSKVHPGQPHEPGWLGGELNGKVGWFPEAYVELADAASGAAVNTLQPIGEYVNLPNKLDYISIFLHPEYTTVNRIMHV